MIDIIMIYVHIHMDIPKNPGDSVDHPFPSKGNPSSIRPHLQILEETAMGKILGEALVRCPETECICIYIYIRSLFTSIWVSLRA